MATAPTQIRIDADIKKQATDLFNTLGLDMSGAVNLFLHQNFTRMKSNIISTEFKAIL